MPSFTFYNLNLLVGPKITLYVILSLVLLFLNIQSGPPHHHILPGVPVTIVAWDQWDQPSWDVAEVSPWAPGELSAVHISTDGSSTSDCLRFRLVLWFIFVRVYPLFLIPRLFDFFWVLSISSVCSHLVCIIFVPLQIYKCSCDSILLVLQCLRPMLFLYSEDLFAFTLTVILLLYPNHTRASSMFIFIR